MKSDRSLVVLAFGILTWVIASLQLQPGNLYFAVSGDLMLGRGVSQAHTQGGWGETLAALMPWTACADLAFANLESPLTQAPLIGETLDLRGPSISTTALQSAGFDLVSLANNHAMDAGLTGLEDTRRALAAAGIQSIGPDPSPTFFRLRGVKLAWLAFDDTQSPLSVPEAQSAVRASQMQADLVLISIHWGCELEPAPNERQQELARALADAGADLIVGHHPHVLQRLEWVWGASRGRPTLVAYSLGNAMFDQTAPPAVRYGALLLVEANAGGIIGARALPFQIDPYTMNTLPAGPEARQAIQRSLDWPVLDLTTPTP